MEAAFWRESWELGGTKTSFHLPKTHEYASSLIDRGTVDGLSVLVPLCGKTVDMAAFAKTAARVVGVELVPEAVFQFFEEQGLRAAEVARGVHQAGNITIYNNDLFDLSPARLGYFDFVYDRAALVALPEHMRDAYVRKIMTFTRPRSRYFLNTLEYTPALPEPPFSVTPAEVKGYFGDHFDIRHEHDDPRPGHRMIEKFRLDHLREHGFLMTRL
ncbi:thiopurine S-methyltransferase [Amycolatopsis sp. NPDC004378]